MAVVDRNVLRLAAQEFLLDKETPKTIVINEAIDIARRYSTQESPQFINGILDSIKKELDGIAHHIWKNLSDSVREAEADRGSRVDRIPRTIDTTTP